MDTFDRLLALELARMLDPIVTRPAPRRRQPGARIVLRAVSGGLSILPADMAVIAEPVPVSIQVTTVTSAS